MECVEMNKLIVPIVFYLFSTIIGFYIIKKIDTYFFKEKAMKNKKEDEEKGQGKKKKFPPNLEDEAFILSSANDLYKKQQGDDTYFTDEFYKLMPYLNPPKEDYFRHFGKYVSMTLTCMNSEIYKEKLITEIHKLIGQVVHLDIEKYLNDIDEQEKEKEKEQEKEKEKEKEGIQNDSVKKYMTDEWVQEMIKLSTK